MNLVTALITDKRRELSKGKKYKDRSLYPLTLVLHEYDLKLSMILSVDGDVFELYINALLNFYELPYKYDLVPEGDPSVSCTATVKFNNNEIGIPDIWINREFVRNF